VFSFKSVGRCWPARLNIRTSHMGEARQRKLAGTYPTQTPEADIAKSAVRVINELAGYKMAETCTAEELAESGTGSIVGDLIGSLGLQALKP
jgi:hypothetical protein